VRGSAAAFTMNDRQTPCALVPFIATPLLYVSNPERSLTASALNCDRRHILRADVPYSISMTKCLQTVGPPSKEP